MGSSFYIKTTKNELLEKDKSFQKLYELCQVGFTVIILKNLI